MGEKQEERIGTGYREGFIGRGGRGGRRGAGAGRLPHQVLAHKHDFDARVPEVSQIVGGLDPRLAHEDGRVVDQVQEAEGVVEVHLLGGQVAVVDAEKEGGVRKTDMGADAEEVLELVDLEQDGQAELLGEDQQSTISEMVRHSAMRRTASAPWARDSQSCQGSMMKSLRRTGSGTASLMRSMKRRSPPKKFSSVRQEMAAAPLAW